jgi:replicative DNA helicase
MDEMAERGVAIDLLTVMTHLRTSSTLETAGGVAYVAGLVDGLPRISNLGEWAQIVLTAARRREAIELARALAVAAWDERASVDAALDAHQQALMGLLSRGDGQNDVTIKAALKDANAALDKWLQSGSGVTGIPSSLPTLDRLTSGFQPGQLIIIAARPGCGKSVLCGQMSIAAATAGYAVRSYTLEMPPSDVVLRAWLSDADTTKWECRQHGTSSQHWDRAIKSYERLAKLPVTFDRRESPTVAEIRASATRHQKSSKLDLVVVDYLQRVSYDDQLKEHIGVGRAAKALKNLARALEVPVICASQLTRATEHKPPTLSDLALSGKIENEADIVLALHPDQDFKSKSFPNVKAYMLKHRTGACHTLSLSFEKMYARFIEVHRGNGNGNSK